jgi:hypothetical protein
MLSQPLSRASAKPLLDERFATFNGRFFEGRLRKVPVVFFNRFRDPVTQEEKLAGYMGDAEVGVIFLTDEAINMGADFAADSLLHEMIHVAQRSRGDDGEKHGASFTSIANRIADALGLEHVEPNSRGADCWPQTLR